MPTDKAWPPAPTAAGGGPLAIRYRKGRLLAIDRDSASPNARVIWSERNLSEGNRQLAQAVSAVLSPAVE